MQRWRKFPNFGSFGGANRVPPNPETKTAQGCTCGAPGGWYGHERHCGEVEPAPGGAVPNWNHTSTDVEDLEF